MPDEINRATFENAYNQFLALAEHIPSIQRKQVIHVLGSPSGTSQYYRALELYFPDRPTMANALRSQAGQVTGQMLHQHFTASPYRFEMIFAEVYEEAVS